MINKNRSKKLKLTNYYESCVCNARYSMIGVYKNDLLLIGLSGWPLFKNDI